MLYVTIHHAFITHNTDALPKWDPYLIIQYGSQQARTKVLTFSTRTPVWNDTFPFRKCNDMMLHLQLWDQDRFMRDDLIGAANLNIYNVLANPPRDLVETPVEIYFNGKSAGRLTISVRTQPLQAVNAGMSQQPVMPAQLINSYPTGTNTVSTTAIYPLAGQYSYQQPFLGWR